MPRSSFPQRNISCQDRPGTTIVISLDPRHALLCPSSGAFWLIRVEQQVPANAEFTVLNNENPYGCNSFSAISVYRRPLPTTNIPDLSTVMWDGRETLKDAKGNFQPIKFDLEQQARDATMIHAQGQPPTPEQIQEIIDFETNIFAAQIHDSDAGTLDDDGDDNWAHNTRFTLHLSQHDKDDLVAFLKTL